MSENGAVGTPGGEALPPRLTEAVETLKALVMGEADALVVETAEGPRVFTLRDASEPYRKLIERMSQAAVILHDGIVVYCNGALGRALGRGSLIGVRLAELVSDEDQQRFDAFLAAAAAGPAALEAGLRKADGRILVTRMAPAPLSFDGMDCIALVATPLEDIDSWRVAQADLVESERRFKVALGNSPIVVFEQDRDLRYTWIFNPKLGYRANDVLGRTDAELMDPAYAPHVEAIKRKVIATGEATRAEIQTAAPGGQVQTYDLYVEPRRDAAGVILGVICAATDITERKQAEEALRESEARKAFLLALTDAFKTLDTADEIVALAAERLGRRLDADQVVFVDVREDQVIVAREWNGGAMPSNAGVHRLPDFGPVVEDLRAGRSVIVHDVASDPRLGAASVQAHFKRVSTGAYISVPLVANGRLVWGLSVHKGEARRWSAADVALAEEVAERTWSWFTRARAEQALREGEKRMAEAQARAGVGTFWWEIASGRTQFNDCYYRLYGVPPEPHGFEDFLALVHPDDRDGVRANLERALRGSGSYQAEYRLRRVNDGVERWFISCAQAVFDQNGRPTIVGGIVQDITARKRAELALRDSEERYRLLYEGQRDAFVLVDMAGPIVEFNAAYHEMLGYTPDELRTLTYKDLTPERWRAFEENIVQTQILQRGFSDLYEKEYIRKDGSVFPVELRCLLMRDAQGNPCSMWAIVRDISARKQAEAALAAAKAEAERANLDKSRFLAAASHDLRQPVQSLMLLLPLVERHIQPTPKAAQVLGLMGKALGGLNVLLTAVLDVSRLDAGGIDPSPEIVSLRGLCERLAAEYAPKAETFGLGLRVRARDGFACTDPALLERVLRNLMENALRYTHRGGVLLAMRPRGQTMRIDVVDTGVGIPADRQKDIFKEFTQLDNPGRDLSRGLGLGLAIVARLSSLLNLNVAVLSRPARGSRFSITLPMVEPAAPKPTSDDEAAPRSGAVLVIEDNQILRLAIETILRESGYDTIAAASGEEAINLAGRGPVDAIVTDYRLGAGLNGVEAAREIERRLGRKTPKLLLTGEIANQRLDEIDLSDFELLYKPISVEKLQAKLAIMLQLGG